MSGRGNAKTPAAGILGSRAALMFAIEGELFCPNLQAAVGLGERFEQLACACEQW